MNLQWFLSGAVRHASAMAKHVQKLLNHQRDILSPQAVETIQAGILDLRKAVAANPGKEALAKEMEQLDKTANKWLRPYPNAAWRENVEVLLVALTVAMGIRTFFLQPFKIPTGSMQPTLFGVTSQNLLQDPSYKIPTGLARVREWFEGISYLEVVADNDGRLDSVEQPVKFLIFNLKQTLYIGGRPYTLWFPPDYGSYGLDKRASLAIGQQFKAGETVLKLRVDAGDHLFVDRVSFNFRAPDRGEIIVFETKGIPEERRDRFGIPGDQFYIKRLVGLGGEQVEISPERHLIINGKPLDASMPHFEKVYGFNKNDPPRDSHYSGHVDVAMLAPFFQEQGGSVKIPPGHFMVMGDNTVNSLDSRAWGPFPSSYVIGKALFVYWPITDRFGWGYHR
jgi:signal peptidase I